ncbi:DsbA family oxidoreductase [Nocardiopsis sp. RSe5-2]|uniref:DsbA family oxidoreductase n=1 Tax=Nocardiopsis endophytica TaxID=3018445 RepID=A0ABT4UCR7_9ACTN|nr:DsbA family oxidoreductase [Nocardiopsis endophytica]MDA2814772.1 DsbA family oxidoreductase [Nocardiopsis endophytica]
MRVDIWSDIVCPWCYIGKARFERALASFEHADEVEVEFHSFQLDPSAPEEPEPLLSFLADRYGMSTDQARETDAGAGANAEGEGLAYTSARKNANTFDAHRLLHLARERGRQREAVDTLFRANFGEGADVFGREALVGLAEKAGLDADEARRVLEEGRYADHVKADVEQARALGATGVPFFVIDERYGVSGAQPADVFTRVLEKAWEERD